MKKTEILLGAKINLQNRIEELKIVSDDIKELITRKKSLSIKVKQETQNLLKLLDKYMD